MLQFCHVYCENSHVYSGFSSTDLQTQVENFRKVAAIVRGRIREMTDEIDDLKMQKSVLVFERDRAGKDAAVSTNSNSSKVGMISQ